jgi:hypothetical protein
MTGLSRQACQDVAQTHLHYAYVMLAGDKESMRASHWRRVSPRVRKMIAWMAGLDGKKGDAPLQSLTALERGKLHCEARRLIKELEIVVRCAQGGQLPSQFPAVAHESDGIAA